MTRRHLDGRVFSRTSIVRGNGTAVAVCLDCSISMARVISEVGGVVGAMVEALGRASGNVACWHFGDEVVRVPVERMDRVRLLGGTHTEKVLRESREWLLAQREERKVIALFTDGQPARAEECTVEVAKCRAARIRLLVGAVRGHDPGRLRSTMPGAEVFEVGDNLIIGFQQAIRRIAD